MLKLKSKAGESISETLIALLISSLALLMLAGAVSAGTRVILQSKDKMELYYGKDSAMVNQSAAALSSKIDLTNVSSWRGTADTVDTEEELDNISPTEINVSCYKNDEFTNRIVYFYVVANNSL